MILSDKAKAFLERKPELIGTVAGYQFYEHPAHGDEVPLCTISPEGKLTYRSDFWELPTEEEMADCLMSD
jgi:hypothetical protein